MQSFTRQFLAWGLIVLVLCSCFTVPASANSKQVLVLNSYHQGYRWTDNIVSGIMSVLGSSTTHAALTIEDMDTKRISRPEYLERLYEVYKYKFQNRKFDVVICTDDTAFNFVSTYRQELFPGTPVVFCGINYLDEAMLAGKELMTGVAEEYDIRRTLELMLMLHPNTRTIYIINDKTITGQANLRTLNEILPDYTKRVSFTSLGHMGMPEVQQTVAGLADGSLILFLNFFEDGEGKHYDYKESISLVADKSRVPVYGLWDFYLGHGIVGGMLTSGYFQGVAVAKIAEQILNGEQPANIPIVRNSPNRFMFDRVQLERFGIKSDQLPENSIIINETYSNKKQILLLNSYHHGMEWVEEVERGVRAVLGDTAEYNLYVDFFDAKRNFSPEYGQKMNEVFLDKFATKKFDAVIVSDEPAYNFALSYQQALFPDIPIVFLGVNDYRELSPAKREWITGVVETIDLKGTIDLALKLHPETQEVVVINDKTGTGMVNRELMRVLMPQYMGRVRFNFFEDMNMSEVLDKVAVLPSDRLILLLTFNQDKSNNVFTYEECVDLIAGAASVPIYSVWDFYVGHGIVGGRVTSGYSQGETAARLAKEALQGKKPETIPVVMDSPNRYMFNSRQLEKYNIAENRLPPDSIVINRPESFYDKYKTLVWTVSGVIVGLLFVIAALYHLMAERRKTAESLKLFATVDPMTGLLNRHAGLAYLAELIGKNKPATVCFTDVNDLKLVNDTYGHHEGDQLIRTVADIFLKNLRETDLVCRLGGDEFLLILPGLTPDEAEAAWTKIAENFTLYNEAKHKEYQVIVSHGQAYYDGRREISVDELVREADCAMYQEKYDYKQAACSVANRARWEFG